MSIYLTTFLHSLPCLYAKCHFIVHPKIIQKEYIYTLFKATLSISDFRKWLNLMRVLWLGRSCTTDKRNWKTFPRDQKAHQKGFSIQVNAAKQTSSHCAGRLQSGFHAAPWVPKDALDLAADTAEMWVWFLIQKLTVYEYS